MGDNVNNDGDIKVYEMIELYTKYDLRIHTYTLTYIHAYIQTYTYIYIHTYNCKLV